MSVLRLISRTVMAVLLRVLNQAANARCPVLCCSKEVHRTKNWLAAIRIEPHQSYTSMTWRRCSTHQPSDESIAQIL